MEGVPSEVESYLSLRTSRGIFIRFAYFRVCTVVSVMIVNENSEFWMMSFYSNRYKSFSCSCKLTGTP